MRLERPLKFGVERFSLLYYLSEQFAGVIEDRLGGFHRAPGPFRARHRGPTSRVQRFVQAEGFELTAEFVEVETGKGSDALDPRPQLAAAPIYSATTEQLAGDRVPTSTRSQRS